MGSVLSEYTTINQDRKSKVLRHIHRPFLTMLSRVTAALVLFSVTPSPCPTHWTSFAVILFRFLSLPQVSLTDHCIFVPTRILSRPATCVNKQALLYLPHCKSFNYSDGTNNPPSFQLSEQPQLPKHKFQSTSAPTHTRNISLNLDKLLSVVINEWKIIIVHFSIHSIMIQLLRSKPTNFHAFTFRIEVSIRQLLHVSAHWGPKHVVVDVLTFWRRTFFSNFSTPCI